MRRLTVLTYVFVLGLMLCVPAPLYASITIKISANNPSRFTEREVPVMSFLPRGVRPEHVIDSGGLEIECDDNRGQCFVHKNVTLGPQASATFVVEIDDIWLIDENTLGNLENKTKVFLKGIAGTDYAGSAAELEKRIKANITGIRIKQEASLASRVGPTGHITAYEDSEAALRLVEKDIEDLEQLFDAAKGAAAVPAMGGIKDREMRNKILRLDPGGKGNSCLVDKALKEEKQEIVFDAPATVSFGIMIENPSATESRTIPLRHYLLEEVRGKDVVDAEDLKVGLDFEKSLYYVYLDNIRLGPAESKTYTITLNNKWAVDKRKVYSSKIFVKSMVRSAEKEELNSVKTLGEKSLSKVDTLLSKLGVTELSEDIVRGFRQDQETIGEIERSIQKMKDLLLEAGISAELSLLDQEKACREAMELGLEEDELDEALTTTIVLEAQKDKTASGFIFKGTSVATISTWKVIAYIILFLGVISAIFYFLSIREQKSAMFDVLTGAFTRGYALERLREEVKIAKGGGKKCSLLVMDIDKFKGVNDKHGHSIGDVILKEFVIAMRKGIRATDHIGRFGGDEFVIILPTSQKEMAYKIAKGVCKIVEDTPIRISPQLTLNITTSIGVATFPDDSATAEDLFDKADKALYLVKRRGGNDAESFGIAT